MATLTTAKPGDIVVSLSSIVDQLKGKLTSTEVDALVEAILGRRKSAVFPGDLVTASLMNQMLSDIQDLQVRVASIEGKAGGAEGQLILTRPVNGDQFRVGDEMLLEGKNLGFTQGSSFVTLDGVRATEYRPGATDSKITLKVPSISVSTADGRDVVLLVANDGSSASRVVRILPNQSLSGEVGISWVGVSPSAANAGAEVTFEFDVRSGANLDAYFLVSPTVSRVSDPVAWNGDNLTVFEGDTERRDRRILLRSGASVRVKVRIDVVPAVATNTTFSLSVQVASGVVKGSTGRLRFSVGPTISLPDPDTSVAISDVAFNAPGEGVFTRGTESDVLMLTRTKTAMATLVVRVRQAGDYLVRVAPLNSPDYPTTQWTLRPHPQDPVDPTNPMVTLFTVTRSQVDQAGPMGVPLAPRSLITADSGASASGEAQLTVERRGAVLSRAVVLELAAS